MERTEIVIIGAGVVGLAIARELGERGRDVVVIEKHPAFGQETSSRNSEVIHAGIYYPEGSLKARLCVEGKRLLYEFCREHSVPHKHVGKLIVANDGSEKDVLDGLVARGRKNGVDDLVMLDGEDIKRLEPNVMALCAIHSPSTGIIDTHALMKRLEGLAKNSGVLFAYGCEVTGVKRNIGNYIVTVRDSNGEALEIMGDAVINAAGLNADKIAAMAGIDIDADHYRLKYSKGEYFRMSAAGIGPVSRLIYPPPGAESLGIHTVVDLQGQFKLGPNSFYVRELDYTVDEAHRNEFFESARRYLPRLEERDLTPDQAGIRPKLQGQGEPAADFMISHEIDKKLPGFIDLIGIESPGLTASLAIAKYVHSMV